MLGWGWETGCFGDLRTRWVGKVGRPREAEDCEKGGGRGVEGRKINEGTSCTRAFVARAVCMCRRPPSVFRQPMDADR